MPPPPEGFQPPILWGTEDHVREIFDGTGVELEFERQTVRIEYDSLDAGMAENEETVPPVVAARKVLEPEGKWDALRADLAEMYSKFNDSGGDALTFDGEYLLTVGTKGWEPARPRRRGRPRAAPWPPRSASSTSSVAPVADQLDRVGVAVDDPLEEVLAVVVGGERALGPAAHVVQDHGELGVGLAELVGDLALHALRERGRGALGRDRDRHRALADDRREDEVAERRDVDDVDEHRPALGVLVDADVDVGVVGRRDDDEGALEVGGLVGALLPVDRALLGELRQRVDRVGRDQRHVAAAGEQALDLLEADVAAADDHALAAAEPQAGDVDGRVEHVAHAGLVADPALELADALLALIGLSGHEDQATERASARAPAPARASPSSRARRPTASVLSAVRCTSPSRGGANCGSKSSRPAMRPIAVGEVEDARLHAGPDVEGPGLGRWPGRPAARRRRRRRGRSPGSARRRRRPSGWPPSRARSQKIATTPASRAGSWRGP